MIVYQANKADFLDDHDNREIEHVIATKYLERTGRYAPDAEYRAWKNSLGEMAKVLRDPGIPDDVGVGVEFGIPQTSKRIDFIISGRTEAGPNLIIVELKQWSEASLTGKDGIIAARRGGAAPEREGAHPCYQAWSYAALLEGFNEAVYQRAIALTPCAYLHNYVQDGIIDHPEYYGDYIRKAPLFLKGEEERRRLRDFIKQHVKYGDNAGLIYQIENGRIRPSKMLVDSLVGMMKGNREFVLIDDQKVAFESAAALATAASVEKKQVVIIKGGPGTGKSVIAVNLLAHLSKQGLVCKYVSKNAAPRAVFKAKLKGNLRLSAIDNLFSGSGSFIETGPDAFDVLIVDEAHRLNEKSGMYGNLGENQIKEIIRSSKCAIFFVDDDQIVTLSDIGHSEELARWARSMGAQVSHLELSSQFRCSGSDGYLAWLDNTLGLRETANTRLDCDEFDFRVVDSPNELHDLIAARNGSNKARVVAGYCWDWVSKRNPDLYDIVMPEHGYARRWNLDRDGSLWIVTPTSVDEVGCIHTCQGLELDYIGVIIGPDMVARDGTLTTTADARSPMDRSIRGWKSRAKIDPDGTSAQVDRIIRNTYKTLLTRGMKGCYVYCVDAETREFLRSCLRGS
ncbi:DNA/RNA helicase domain-containing protein [Frateuria sp. GZRR33]|uniref:DNA/RNA helicase domain-containing protein n=1 Tax=Frateuria sp. GZRR33 TaxID=3351535 RepID=UPI003EDCA8CF